MRGNKINARSQSRTSRITVVETIRWMVLDTGSSCWMFQACESESMPVISNSLGVRIMSVFAGIALAMLLVAVAMGAPVWLLVTIGLAAAWNGLGLLIIRSRQGRRAPQGGGLGYGVLVPKGADVVMNSGPGTFECEVVGESHYLDVLRQVVRDEGLDPTQPGEFFCQVFLLCETENPHHKNAVAVVLRQQVVGRLARADADVLAPQLRKLANTSTGSGGKVLCVQACVGWSHSDAIGVRLDMDVE